MDCLEAADTGVRIKGCSTVIDANPNDAPAYYTRGIAYQSRGEIDRAIADYSSAIELNPYHASAYEARARAYAGKGDYVHAVADVTKAGELVSASASAAPPKQVAPPAEAAARAAPRAPEEVKTATTAIPNIGKKEDGLPKKTSPATREVKAATPQASRKVEKKPAPSSAVETWPAWAPQGHTDN